MKLFSTLHFKGCDGVHYLVEGFVESINFPTLPEWPVVCNRTVILPPNYRIEMELLTFSLCDNADLTVSIYFIVHFCFTVNMFQT